jgi:beta-glucanase (GH16 family)
MFKKIKKKALCCIFGIFISILSHGQMPEGDQNWDIIFFDNFNSIDTSIWDTDPFPIWHGADYEFHPNKLSINSSNLLITSTENGSMIETGAIQSKESYGFGYFEARIKFQVQGTTWNNAFWLARGYSNIPRGSDGLITPYYHPCCNAPSCTPQDVWWDEIDIEVLQDYQVTSNIHRVFGNCTNSYEPGIMIYNKTNDYINNYHIYGIEYSSDKIRFYLDNYKWDERNSSQLPDSSLWIIFNTGFIYKTGNIANNTFPGYYYVDWVKYYKLKTSLCETDATILSNSDLQNFQYGLRRNITLGNGSSNIYLNYGDKVTLRASNSININGSFTVPIGSTFDIIPTQCNYD